MASPVRLSAGADHDLTAIADFIAQDNPQAAGRTIARILQSLEFLAIFPLPGRPGILPGTRGLLIQGLPFRAVYTVEPNCVSGRRHNSYVTQALKQSMVERFSG